MRLDKYLHDNQFTTSRNRAQELIVNKKVKVDGKIITKPSYQIETQDIEIVEDTLYVSRAAEKLKLFFKANSISVDKKICLDIGSSTGGFVQVLCEHGAKSVVAVDVGKDQLHPIVKEDSRVISFQKMDIRDFQSDVKFDFVTCDVSFVGISYILKDIDRLAKDEIVILFKPQFEVGKDIKRDKRGVVKDLEAIILASKKFEESVVAFGWKLILKQNSKIKGKSGNEEIFYYFKK